MYPRLTSENETVKMHGIAGSAATIRHQRKEGTDLDQENREIS